LELEDDVTKAELYTLAFPDLDKGATDWLASLIALHDPDTAARVGAHFTIGFGVSGLSETIYSSHLQSVATATAPITFTCRRAVVGTDHEHDFGYVFLVPDEGNSDLYALHDAFYTNAMTEFRRLDIPFKPHITVAQVASVLDAANIASQINSTGCEISGHIRTISAVSKSAINEVTTIAEARLTGCY